MLFLQREQNWRTGENLSEQHKDKQQIQPTYATWPESIPGYTGGGRALLSLHKPCSPNNIQYYLALIYID